MTQEGRRYEVEGTTADVAIRAIGRSVDELFTNAAWGMVDLMCDSGTVRGRREWEVEAAADGLETLLVDLLTEVLVLLETEDAVAAEVSARVSGEGGRLRASARVRGEPRDPDRHEMLHGIKAVTYHTLAVRPDEGFARVLLDV